MKKINFTKYFVVTFFFSISLIGQGQNWLWAKNSTGNGTFGDEGYSTSNDVAGNVYMTGAFNSSVFTLGTNTLNNTGTYNTFIAKYDQLGNIIWAKSSIGAGNDFSYSIANDANNNSFITGSFKSNIITFGSYTLANTGTCSAFITKYDPNGIVLWTRASSGSGNDEGHGVTIDATGNSYITGFFNSPIVTFGTYTLGSTGTPRMFLVKYDPNGLVLWAKSAGGTIDERGYSTSTDLTGNVFVTGFFKSPTIVFGTYTLTNTGNSDVFLVKYDTNGNVLWARNSTCTGNDEGHGVTTDNIGNVIITGFFGSSNMVFGTNTLTNVNSGTNDVFITKYDSNGNALWAKSLGGSSFDMGYSVSTNTNSIFLSGSFNSPSITIGASTYTAPTGPSYDPMFIVSYDFNGNVNCSSILLSGGDDQNGISADKLGNAYIVSDYKSFPLVIGTNTLTLSGNENIFLAKYNCAIDLGLNELNQNSSFLVYPNPTDGSFKIQIDNDIKNGQLILINSLGQKVHEQKLIQGTNEIKTNGLPIGLYNFIVLRDNQTLKNGKLIIE